MAVDLQGNIINEQGDKTGGQVDVLTGEMLQEGDSIQVPDKPVGTDPTIKADAAINTSLEDIQGVLNQTTAEDAAQGTFQAQIQDLSASLSGEAGTRRTLEEEAGVTADRDALSGIVSQLKALKFDRVAVPLQIQEESAGRGRTRAGVAPLETARLRTNAIKSLQLAATGSILQGNISLAEQHIANALEAEFEPQRIELAALEQAYEFNKDTLERQDKKRADNLALMISERNRLLNNQETNKKTVYDLAKTAQEFGAPTDVVQKALESGDPESALTILGSHIQDPKAKVELANAIFQGKLQQLQFNKASYELDILKKYDGMSPTEYAAEIRRQQEEIASATEEREKASLQADALNQKSILLDSVLESKAIDSVVGPTFLSRAATTPGGVLVRGAVTLPLGGIGALQGAKDALTGSSDKLIGQVEQFISKEFLQSLIDVKAQGATFGALQKAEQDALTAAATFIGQRRIEKGEGENRRVVGYDLSEADFKRELQTIKDLTALAHERAIGKSFSPEQQAAFDAMDKAQNDINFNPAF